MLKGEEYLLQLEANNDRFASNFQQVLSARLADIERFFVDGIQKDPMQRWIERHS